jgi:hypothetical protein
MKSNRLALTAILLAFASMAGAQQSSHSLLLKNGAVTLSPNIRASFLDSFNARVLRYNNKAFAVLQFGSIPGETQKKILSANGIELLEYIPQNAYTISFSGNLNITVLQQAGAEALTELEPEQKMDAYFARGYIPSWAVKTEGTVDAWISFPKTITADEVIKNLRQLNVDVVSAQHQSYRILALRFATNRLRELAALPFIEYIQPAPPADQPLNFNSRNVSRANFLNASVANGGKGLNGEGVTIGIGDNSDVQTHIDFTGRLINRAAAPTTYHGQHTTGTMAGAGNIIELYRGYAPKATIVSQYFSGILTNAATYVTDYGMVVTNNSYGDIMDCDYHGTYDLSSRIMDQMAIDLPNLENVFAAGNSGGSTCFPASAGYHTVLGGYQSAKNVLTVGATTDSGLLASFSSRGPVKDGRLKPEIMTMGQFLLSTTPVNGYGYNSGTSMAAPGASGGLALLYQRYRQLNGGANPKNGLMKALVCNGTKDLGNTGPDYQYGFGWMNLLRSVDMMENNRYFTATVAAGSSNIHPITVPANTAQLKVMLYWNDPAASLLSIKTLVNDLDLEVTNASGTTFLPGVLDTSNTGVVNLAVSAADHLNNMEQVVINAPASGSYTLKVKGTAITQNPSQEYFLVYDAIPVQLKMTAPAGGEGLVPGEQTKISWESYGLSPGTATLEYSTNNGASWSTIVNNIDINRTVYTWWVPAVATNQALVRITKNGSGESSTGNLFTIVGMPVITLNAVQCEGYVNIDWTAVAGATDYELMLLQGDDMKSIGITTSTSYAFSGLLKDSVYWVTVRPRVNGKPGRRAQAISRQPNNGSCSGTISDNDLKLDAIVSPVTGRKFTSTQIAALSTVTVRIKNLDDAPVSNFTVSYSINGGAPVSENVTTTITAGALYTHNFAAQANLSATGNYTIVAVVKNNTADPVTKNDTAVVLMKNLDNQPLNLTTAFLDNIETALPATYQVDTIGLAGLDRYDFSHATASGRLRTFINTGIAYSGTKALSLDADRYFPAGNVNYLYGTFNLVNYSAASNDLRLDFQFNNHGQEVNPANKVWIRGNDTQSWIEVYDLNTAQTTPGIYKKTSSIELSKALAANAQNFGTSFQVRWGQYGQLPATDKENASGYSFDDIRLYQTVNDLQLQSIDTPFTASCGLNATTPVKISIRNTTNAAITNIPVRYRINNGTWIIETVPSIAANAVAQYTFTTSANLSAFGVYTIQTVVDYSADSFHENDTASIVVHNLPVINSFPYLQGFEANDGFWFSGGKKSSWEYGTPASTKINRAANGAKAWKTKLAGTYNDNELSYLYSPCFDVSGLAKPTLSFSAALDIEDCGGTLCDGAWVEYSTDGTTWIKLGSSGIGTNWYNKPVVELWSIQNYTNWHVATMALPTGATRLRFRFVMQSDPGVDREGIAIDDIHVYDNTKGIYDGLTLTAPVTQTVSGNSWIDFTSSGKLVASMQPNNQSLGTTAVQAYINTGGVRNNNNQYYHDRNITIKPSGAPTDSVAIRFYFLDKEVDSLLKASGCSSCTKPTTAYELGVSKYSDPDPGFENGTILDNQQGSWKYISSPNVAKVPFDKGYYAEFKVKDFSEFWLSNGGFDHNSPLPVKLMNFTAQKQANSDVLLKWDVGSEASVSRYEIEVARGDAELQAGHFVKIGEVASAGNTTVTRQYSFTDTEADKFGTRYYRLKIVNLDASFLYSVIRPVVFGDVTVWTVYPNPSSGIFNLVYQLNNNENLEAKIYDAKGSLVKLYTKTGNGVMQKLVINLGDTYFASGIYLLRVTANGKDQQFKLYKQ